MKKRMIPEVLAPAGSLDKLKIAILYGADAVYVGGQKFGLRTAAENFTLEELAEGVSFAHEQKAKVYVVINSFLHDQDIIDLEEYVLFLDKIKVDAVIVSDMGVAQLVKKLSSIPIHVSTQASTLNVYAARLWKRVGASRIVLGREVSISEAGRIKKEAGIEVELFVHGSMCMAYSGHCVISNFTQGRDSNRGGCAHSCRFEYSLEFDKEISKDKKNAYFMSSKDLAGIRLLQDFIDQEIDSLKIEGRMKSPLYAGTMSKVYSEALRYYKNHGDFLSDDLLFWEEELKKVSHRSYTQGSLLQKAQSDSVFNERESVADLGWQISATVVESTPQTGIVLEVRNAFNKNDLLEALPFEGLPLKLNTHEVLSLSGESLERTKPTTLVRLPYQEGVQRFHLVRKQVRS